jgi:DNA-binding SARP family transcriptional activator
MLLRIRLLGELEVRADGELLPPLDSSRARSLLAYLLLHREAPQPRQRVAFLFWPDSTEGQARTNLRHLLHNLSHSLPLVAPFLEVTAATLRWREAAPVWLDVAALEAALTRGEAEGDGAVAALREAADLYRGELLEGCYDEWISAPRERLRQRHLRGLERLTALLEARGEHAAAIGYAEQLLARDPLDEATYRLLMRLHGGRGDRARALRTYHRCAATLESELGVEPSAATREAYEALLPPERTVPARETPHAAAPPLIGRAAPWERLTAAWRCAERGCAQMVLVTGEPGVGKTRLVDELRSWCAHRGVPAAEARSYAAEGSLAYGQVAAWLQSEALRPHLSRLDRGSLTEIARLLPELLDEVPGLPRPEPLPEEDHRRRLFAALTRAILAPDGPLLLVADDVHWGDRDSARLLHHLLRAAPHAPILVAATARREEMDANDPLHELVLGLHRLDRFTEIALERLSPEETALLGERLRGRALEATDADRLYAETEGNPLFVVEAIRGGWSGNGGERAWVSPRVQAVIESRLARLSAPARELTGVAATIGREFTTEVLEQASGVGGEPLLRSLDELWRRRIVREHGTSAYDFSHDRIREVAYLSLGPARRRHHHLAVAHALERLHARDPAPVSGRIAGHYDRAGLADEAVAWYEAAAEAAQLLHASAEAVRLLERALELLRSLPATAERETRELSVLTRLLTPLAAVDGFASPRVAAAHARALQLGRALGIGPAPQILRSLAVHDLCTRDFAGARRHAERLLGRGREDADDVLIVEAAYLQGIAAFWRGELRSARRHFERAVARYRPEHGRSHLLRYGLDPRVVCLSRLANTLALLDRAEPAVRARDLALAGAREVGHSQSHATALVFAALLALDLGDPEGVREHAAALVAQPAAHEVKHLRATVDALHGYLAVLDGRTASGLAAIEATIHEPVEQVPGMNAVVARLLVAAAAAARDTRAGLAAADRALALCGEVRLWEAEIRRCRAELRAALGGPAAEVTAELEHALRIAQRQGAALLERRARESLDRHGLAPLDRAAAAS